MTLSILVPTREPASRVAAVLAPLRGVADEIVVAVDYRVPADRLGAYENLGDRIVRFEHSGSNRGLAWLHSHCSGDRVLLLAGDEVVSRELADGLPALCRESGIRQHWFPTRWVWPDGVHWLDELPWWPDFHNRLLLNDDAVWFEGRKHSGARPQSPMRYVEAPLYHLALVMNTVDQREERVRRYEEQRPGLVAPGGGGLNERFYLPERFARRSPAAIPEADRPLVAAVLDARDGNAAGRPARRPVPLGLRVEIDRCWDGRALEPSAYRAAIEPFERDHRIAVGERRTVFVTVRNHGTALWPSGTERAPEIRLSYHWRDTTGATVVHDGERSWFPVPIGPGETAVLPALITAPDAPGEHVLVFDLVHEHVRWFGCETAVPMTVEGQIAPRRRWRRPRR
jgi:hypothetical protein